MSNMRNFLRKKSKAGKYYLTLSTGRTVRVVYNLDVEKKFTEHTGKGISCFVEKKATIFDNRCIAWLMVIEGEKADSKEFKFTEIEFGRIFDIPAAKELNKILMKIAFSQN